MSPADVAETEKALRVWAQDYDSVGIESSYNLTTKNIAYDKHRSELYITISIMLLGDLADHVVLLSDALLSEA